MNNLKTVEIKAFIPSQNFEVSKQFYSDIGFVEASCSDGIAYFYCGACSFLLQDFYEQQLAENFVMHLLVEDVYAWHEKVERSGVAKKYGVNVSEVIKQPWGMLDFTIHDPSGVLWRFGQNITS